MTVQGLATSAASYNNAIEMLKDQYGNSEKVIYSYIQQLLSLPPVKSRNDVASLRSLYNTVSKITKSLKSMGMSAATYGLMVKPMILKALLFSMRSEFHKKRSTSADDNSDNESVHSSVSGSVNNCDQSYEDQINQLLIFIKVELPKLELTAAVCAVRLQCFILENINLKISECVLWSDSKITLYRIKGATSR